MNDHEAFPFVLLGNKVDVDGGNSRKVTEKKAREWCASRGNLPYFETFAKEGYNIEDAFLNVAKIASENEHTQDIYFPGISETVLEAEQRVILATTTLEGHFIHCVINIVNILLKKTRDSTLSKLS